MASRSSAGVLFPARVLQLILNETLQRLGLFDEVVGEIGGAVFKKDNKSKRRDQENDDPEEFSDECHAPAMVTPLHPASIPLFQSGGGTGMPIGSNLKGCSSGAAGGKRESAPPPENPVGEKSTLKGSQRIVLG
ncbi:MAG TPA: hypothetical protein VNQ90_18835 [Chthoniobacteraceae bacterium]|nr:hypothetical protein [Chthoniobacteraceae bacterium]